MRLPTYLLRDPRSALFYFRLRVPRAARETVGRLVIKHATGTRDPRAAVSIASAWALRYAALFAALKGQPMPRPIPPSLEEIFRNLGSGRPEEYKVTTPTGFTFEVETDADHARVKDLLKDLPTPSVALPPGLLAAARATMAPPPAKGLTLKTAFEQWSKLRAAKNKRKTLGIVRTAVRDFIDWAGPARRVRTVTRGELGDYYAQLAIGGLAASTVGNKFLYLSAFFQWLQSKGEYPLGDNPASGHAKASKAAQKLRAKTHGWQAFSGDHLRRIFEPSAYADLTTDAHRWLPLILAYTGARVNEIARLEVEDLRTTDDGTPIFDINLRGEDKSLKGQASERHVPVHPDLIRLGLWERVERLRAAGETKLFPGLTFGAMNGPGGAVSSRFSRYLQERGVKARGSARVGLHSFRDTVIQAIAAVVPWQQYQDAYTGHSVTLTLPGVFAAAARVAQVEPEHRAAYEVDLTPAGLARRCHPVLSWGLDLDGLRRVLDSPAKPPTVRRPSRRPRLQKS